MKHVKRPGDKYSSMSVPAFFEHNGFYAAMLPHPQGVQIIKDAEAPNIAEFMVEGSVIQFKELPETWKESVWKKLEAQSKNK